jgi:serine/threonine-protein kinase
MSTSPDPPVVARFGKCRVVAELGVGSLSTVYRAVEEPLEREVAVKVLRGSIASSSSFAAQLVREARLLAELCHPNVAQLHELVQTDSELYLVLELVAGPSLADLLARRPKLPPEAAAIIGAAIARGLEHVHEHGIVHRDVKPANILVSLRGDVKLIDFGIAQRVDGEQSPEPAVEFNAFGTPAYMSPEQILGDTADARSDLFSLGVVLYQMLTGTRPFEGDDANDRRASTQRIRRAPAVPLRSRAPEVPRPFERVVMRLLEKLPVDRYASAAAVALELEELSAVRVRGSPRGVVARALRDAGFTKTAAPAGDVTEAADPPLRPIYLGFVAILGIGAAMGVAIQLADPQDREAARAGAAPLELAPPGHASLRVLATPWADVWIDGQKVETTPFARAIPLSPGRHFVTLTHPNAPSEQRTLKLAVGEEQLLDVTMRLRAPAPGDAAMARVDASHGGGS